MNKKNNQSMQEYERNNLSEEIKISIINSLEKVFNGQNGRFAIGAFTLIILSTQFMDYFKSLFRIFLKWNE